MPDEKIAKLYIVGADMSVRDLPTVLKSRSERIIGLLKICI